MLGLRWYYVPDIYKGINFILLLLTTYKKYKLNSLVIIILKLLLHSFTKNDIQKIIIDNIIYWLVIWLSTSIKINSYWSSTKPHAFLF